MSIVHQTGIHNYNGETHIANATTTVQIIRQDDTIKTSLLSNNDAKKNVGSADNIYYNFSRIISVTVTNFEII